MRRVLQAAWGRAYPRIVGNARDSGWLFYDVVLPLLGNMGFVLVYRAMEAPDRYVGYVIMGGAAVTLWMSVLWSMVTTFYWEKQSGHLERYMTLPCGLTPILIGLSIGGLASAMVRVILIVAAGVLFFRVPFVIHDGFIFLAVFILSMIALYGLSIATASLFLAWGRDVWHAVNLVMEPVYLLSGFYFPVRSLGFGVAVVASILPLTVALDAMRQMMYPGEHPALLPVSGELAVLAALAVMYVGMASKLIRHMEYVVRRDGRLAVRY